MFAKAGIPLTHQLMDSLCQEIFVLLLESLHSHAVICGQLYSLLMSFI
jgi:hypothetical protein